MKDRILAFLQSENKSYAQFAEEIGVQPSGISHILSGRNNPSLDFVIKMLHRYSSLSADWLLFGRGPMYRHVSQPTLFENEISESLSAAVADEHDSQILPDGQGSAEGSGVIREGAVATGGPAGDQARRITRVLFFYSDKTFTEYKPS